MGYVNIDLRCGKFKSIETSKIGVEHAVRLKTPKIGVIF